MFSIFYIFESLIPIVIFFAIARKIRSGHGASNLPVTQRKNWFLQIALSKEDMVGQTFVLLAFFFFGVGLLLINRRLGELVNWSSIVFTCSILGMLFSYYFKQLYLSVFSFIGTIIWWVYKVSQWTEVTQGEKIKSMIIPVGLFLLAVIAYLFGSSVRDIKKKRLSASFTVLGLSAITVAIFALSTKMGIEGLGELMKGMSIFSSWQVTISIALISLVAAIFIIRNSIYKITSTYETAFLTFVSIVVLSLLFLPAQELMSSAGNYYNYTKTLSSAGVFWAIVFNVLIFFQILGIILLGYIKREEWLINFGAVSLFLLILFKYFDWFFTFLDKSLFFIGAGILLFVVGWFMEKGRRKMISEIKTTS